MLFCSPCRSGGQRWPVWRSTLALLTGILTLPLVAGERRARAPRFDGSQFRGVFYSDVSAAVQPDRPSAPQLQGAAEAKTQAAAAMARATTEISDSGGGDAQWASLIGPVALEDEIKRLKLQYDRVVTTPGAFRSGGYQDARRQLSALAMLFAVVSQYDGEVRWKEEAAAARDLLARTAFNSKAGSVQVYNEAKLRKADLQSLLSGASLNGRESDAETDWSGVVDRAPLMEYLEIVLYDHLDQLSRDAADIEENKASLQRFAEVVAVVGRVLAKEGMPEADDPDYQELSESMVTSASQVVAALQQGGPDRVGIAISEISQSCDACHEQYR